MLKILWLLAALCMALPVMAQPDKIKKRVATDSFQLVEGNESMADDLPVSVLHEGETNNEEISVLPSLLTANRDAFMTAAAFHFSMVRFRIRGYDPQWFSTLINGIQMNNAGDGNTPWFLWNGLNDVTRNTQASLGLRNTDFSFGNMGNTVSMDMRAFKQREQTKFSYAFSNRSFAHRWMFAHSRGMNKKGWAFAVSGSLRYAGEGYFPGTFYEGMSYFFSADKRLAQNKIVSVTFFGSSVIAGKQSPVSEESAWLAGTRLYNAYWGYQQGKKRNTNTGRSHQPVWILSYDYRINNQSSWITAVSGITGQKSSTALDWYKAADPRPDYYRYLPSYQKDSVLCLAVTDAIRQQTSLLQVNWDKLFAANRNSFEMIRDVDGITGNTVSGLRSHYIVEERISRMQRFDINSVFNSSLTGGGQFTAGISFQWQQTHYYKKIDDLLGGEYYVDWNQFAESNLPNDVSVMQNDLNHPNRILHAGDLYGYNYMVRTNLGKAWAQIAATRKHLDMFAAAELCYTNYLRDGKVRTGLFPDNSFGRSRLHEFTNYAFKGGITYKINGRKYLYLHIAMLSKAPLFDNVFISPRTRDSEQENIVNERVQTAEAGYVWNAPRIKLRITGYLANFRNGMNVLTFYHDGYHSFMNYALYGIDKLHTGSELGCEIKLSAHYTLSTAAAIGRYYQNSRQQVTVSADNDAYVMERGLIYSQNFRVAGTPQEAYNAGISYQSSGSFYCNLNGSYVREQWIEFNPLRRTVAALQNVAAGSNEWYSIISQAKLPDQYAVDFLAGTSLRIKRHSKKMYMLLFNININNLLNSKKIISGGYEQLRFDTNTSNVEKFPPKFFYGMGINFSANFSFRL